MPGQELEVLPEPQSKVSREVDAPREADGLVLRRFEVAVAVNLESPARHVQDIIWLQVMAEGAPGAAQAAQEWVLAGSEDCEATGLVREATVHVRSLGRDHRDLPLMIFWAAPVLEDAPMHAVVRDPATGLRLGFVAHPQVEARWLPQAARGSFRLLSRKPTASSEPAGLAPLVVQARDLPGHR
jgi:hypothetical protein